MSGFIGILICLNCRITEMLNIHSRTVIGNLISQTNFDYPPYANFTFFFIENVRNIDYKILTLADNLFLVLSGQMCESRAQHLYKLSHAEIAIRLIQQNELASFYQAPRKKKKQKERHKMDIAASCTYWRLCTT